MPAVASRVTTGAVTEPRSLTEPDSEPQRLAEAAAAAMLAGDRATNALGIALDAVGPGRAVMSMRVADTMLNGHGTCHGGYLFTLADTAFAFACNSHNARAVAQECSVTFLAPAQVGERLVATARERHRRGRTGLYDVTVEGPHGTVAEFRGLSRTVRGHHRPDLAPASEQQSKPEPPHA